MDTRGEPVPKTATFFLASVEAAVKPVLDACSAPSGEAVNRGDVAPEQSSGKPLFTGAGGRRRLS